MTIDPAHLAHASMIANSIAYLTPTVPTNDYSLSDITLGLLYTDRTEEELHYIVNYMLHPSFCHA